MRKSIATSRASGTVGFTVQIPLLSVCVLMMWTLGHSTTLLLLSLLFNLEFMARFGLWSRTSRHVDVV
eukprot:SAG31_NODE_3119_length_4656_cov_3.057055_4_plen_68_part_00